jgi:hypothetical protein
MRLLVIVMVACLSFGCRTTPGGVDDGGGAGGSGGSGGAGGSGGSGPACTVLCIAELTCCGNQCVNTRNDIRNCGGCGVVCPGPSPYCDGNKCAPAPCAPACSGGQLCCEVQSAGPSHGPSCTAPTDGGTCPIGCPLCN